MQGAVEPEVTRRVLPARHPSSGGENFEKVKKFFTKVKKNIKERDK